MRENWWYRVRDNFVCYVIYELMGCKISEHLSTWAVVLTCIVFPSRWFWYVCGKNFYCLARNAIVIDGVHISMKTLSKIVAEASDPFAPKKWFSFHRPAKADYLVIETKIETEEEVKNGE